MRILGRVSYKMGRRWTGGGGEEGGGGRGDSLGGVADGGRGVLWARGPATNKGHVTLWPTASVSTESLLQITIGGVCVGGAVAPRRGAVSLFHFILWM